MASSTARAVFPTTLTEAARPVVCRYLRFGKLYTCSLPHCVSCGSHFDPGLHTQGVLCDACVEWAGLERRFPRAFADATEFAHRTLAARAEEGP